MKIKAFVVALGVCSFFLARDASAQVSRLGDTFLLRVSPVTQKGSGVAYDPRSDRYLSVAGDGTVFGRFTTGAGTVVGDQPFPIGGVSAQYPHVAYSPDVNGGGGGFLVTWHESDGAVPSVHVRLVSSTTGPIGVEKKITGNDTFWEIMGAPVAYSTGSHEFLVVWRQYFAVNILALRLNNNGDPIGGVIPVATTTLFESDPSVAYNPVNNEFFVVYRRGIGSSLNAMGQRIQAGTGALIGGPSALGTGGADVRTTGVTYNPETGQYLAAWQQVPPDAILGRVVAVDGTPLGTVLPLSTRFGTYDSLALDANPASGTSLVVGHDKLGTEDGGVEVGGSGSINGSTLITQTCNACPGNGNFYPRVAAHATQPEWLVVASNRFSRLLGQRVRTSSRGGGGVTPPPSPGPPPLSVNLSANVTLPASQNTAITWTAAASGGTGPFTYQFWKFSEATGWAVAQAYSASNTLTWTPPAGVNAMQVWVRNSGSSANYDAYSGSGLFTINGPAEIASFVADATFPAALGAPVTFTARVQSGTAEYKFWKFTSAGGWVLGRDYGASNTFTWVPPAGNNAVQVWVRRTGSTAVYESWAGSGLFAVAAAPIRIDSFTTTSSFPISPSAAMSWTARGVGGSGQLEYKFWDYDYALGTWSVLRDWSTSNTATTVPGTGNAGQHNLQVWSRSLGSGAMYEAWRDSGPFVITDAVRVGLTTNVPLNALRAGQLVTFTATVAPGFGPWEFAWFTTDGLTWTRRVPFTANANMFTPTFPAGTTAVQVWVRAAGSHAIYENYQSTGFFVIQP